MEIVKSKNGGKAVFALNGRLDTATAPQLQEALIPAFDEADIVELDFERISYISSAGLRVLLLGEKTAKMKNKSMNIVNVSEMIKQVFDMTGFSDILKII
uniref:Anti-sigma factor antagonist n=1 Tax=uncultured bacterium contig00093 TaxID=1181564 RepID=A0A806K0K5_9BACT|nr:anti-sigma F factor antagonist [uncultured bacterium contig00093]